MKFNNDFSLPDIIFEGKVFPTMITGFEQIVEERILHAQKKGDFDNLPGAGKPLVYDDNSNVPEDLRLTHKILKNADCLPPEIELKKEIMKTEDLLAGMGETSEKYRTLKKLNYLIMKLNMARSGSLRFEMPGHYKSRLADRMNSK